MNELFAHIVVPRDHPSLPGHFPGRPIVPGVVLLDLIFDAIRSGSDTQMRIESIASTKFLLAVEPDQRVELKITCTREGDRVKARFIGARGDTAVIEGSFILMPNSASEAA